MMGDKGECAALVEQVFADYDIHRTGELNPVQLQGIHADMRVGSISIPQVCKTPYCRSHIFDIKFLHI